jgi:hypothetical protein
VNFLELIDAYALANANARTAENLGDSLQAEYETQELRAEIERRLKLAKMDWTVAWRNHLDDDEQSQARQRALIEQHAADVAAGRRPYGIVEYCRKDL